MKVKLSKWAKMEGIHYNTAYRWFYLGYIKGAYKSPSGSIFVVIEDKKEETKKQS
jgi:predicted site-specific integrase-resolvase